MKTSFQDFFGLYYPVFKGLEICHQDRALNYEPNEDIGSPVMELNDFGDIGEQFLQTGIVVGPSGDWDCGPKAELYHKITERTTSSAFRLCARLCLFSSAYKEAVLEQ